FLKSIENHKVIAFYGKMGAGKTTFIKAICLKLGVVDNISSPTFSIINEYKTSESETIYHFDFYRIKNISEAFDLGYEDYFYSNSFCFIEWPEKIEDLLPENCLKVSIEEENNIRTIRF
ncbi:MAG: tRNA (adenosine(37)-N6)-threonylcarbamoyltransferase complex ATPase subunit type 1 TsaE, partial [Bacteroidetes bacterium]|nr:tRNA (adenosine(37)-N6)-threonylcarbamoyltransferase complex ATPase subunit type 1 TsaE [Bacteroidota bacterium]